MAALTIAQTAQKLNVTTVRVHGLIKAGKLQVAEQPVQQGTRFVAAITEASIEKLLADRKERGTSNGSRQYILNLTPEQVEELQAAGYELKARFESKKA